jgi:hypothetical protein
VRLEIATALRRKIRVIPVLVDGAKMPVVRELPDDLRSLVRRNALELSHYRFQPDSERLIDAVERALEKTAAQRQRLEPQSQSQPPSPVAPVAAVTPSPPVIATLPMLPVDWMEQVRRYINAKDYAKALPLLQKAADAGDSGAEQALSRLHSK